MGCIANLLSWPAGNDVLLKVRVYEKVKNGQTVTDEPYDLSACDVVTVAVTGSFTGAKQLEYALDSQEDNCLVVRIPYTLGTGTYAVDVRAEKGGYHVRSFDFKFKVVSTDCEAKTTFEVVDGCNSASIRCTLQIVPQAEVRGKSAYEEWKELPGNEGKTLQDFIDEVLNLNENAARALEAAEGAENVNATLSGTTLTVTDRTGHSESVDTKGEPGPPGTTDYNELENKPTFKTVNGESIVGEGDIEITTTQQQSDWNETNNTKPTFIKNKPNIPSQLSQLSEDTTHRTVTDTEKTTWNGKQDNINDLSEIRSGAAAGATAVQTETDPTVPSWAKQQSKPSYTAQEVGALPNNTPLFSGDYNDLTNKPDLSQFITKSVDDLVNYYLKSETYTKAEVQQLIDAIKQFTYEVVQTLPTASADTMHKIYLVPSSDPQTQNVKDEYITIDNGTEAQTRYTWEQIGSTAIDLSGYVTTTALNTALADYTTTANLTTLLAGKQDVIDSSHKLSADLVDDTNTTNKFTNATEKQTWNAKQDALTFNTAPSSSNKVATMADVPITMGASGSGHKGGLVPDTPSTAGTTKFLREDGTWVVPAYPTVPTISTDIDNDANDDTKTASPKAVKTFVENKGYLTQHQDISGKEDVTTIVAPVNATDATLPITSLTCEIGKYYRIDVAVDTLAVTLPAMTDVTKAKNVVLYLTAGTTPAVTISAVDSKDVYYQDGFEIEAGKTYEINALFNGAAWIVAAVEIDVKIVVPEVEEEEGGE